MTKLWDTFANNTRRRSLALLMALLLAVNVLTVALPGRSFKNARADAQPQYESVAMFDTAARKGLDICVTRPDGNGSFFLKFGDGSTQPLIPTDISGGKSYRCTIANTKGGNVTLFAEKGIGFETLTVTGDALTALTVSCADAKKINTEGSHNLGSIIASSTSTKISEVKCGDCALTYRALSNLKSSIPTTATLDYGTSQSDIKVPTFVHAEDYIELSETGACTSTTKIEKVINSETKAELPTNDYNSDELWFYARDNSYENMVATLSDSSFPGLTLKTTPVSVVPSEVLMYYHIDTDTDETYIITDGVAVSDHITKCMDTGDYSISDAERNKIKKVPVDENGYVFLTANNAGNTVTIPSIWILDDTVTDLGLLPPAGSTGFLNNIMVEGGDLGVVDLRDTKSQNISLHDCGVTLLYNPDTTYVTRLDLSNNPNPDIVAGYFEGAYQLVGELDLSGCGLTSLASNEDFPKVNTALDVSNNNLSSIDLSAKCRGITELDVSHNNLTSLDVSTSNYWDKIDASYNHLTEFTPNPEYFECFDHDTVKLDLSHNDLTFDGLFDGELYLPPILGDPEGTLDYTYAPQNDIVIPEEVCANDSDTISLSDYSKSGTIPSTYRWYVVNGDSTATALSASDIKPVETAPGSGIFKFPSELDGKTLYCEISNTDFPGLTYKTTNVKCVKPAPSIPTTPKFAIAYKSEDAKFTINADSPVAVAWDTNASPIAPQLVNVTTGTDSPVSGKATKATGKDYYLINVYCDGNVKSLDISDSDVVALTVNQTNATELEKLDCSENEITVLNLTKNNKLTDLDCSDNKLAGDNLKLPANGGKLVSFDCSENLLTYEKLPAEVAKIKANVSASDAANKKFDCTDQADLAVPLTTVTVGDTEHPIDLSKQATYDGKATKYEWYTVDGTKETKITDPAAVSETDTGVFVVTDKKLAGKTIICKMSNPSAPDLIKTVKINVSDSTPSAPKKVAEIFVPKGTEMSFKVVCDEPVYVNWGSGTTMDKKANGTGSKETITGTSTGKVVSLYTDGTITELYLPKQKATGMDIVSLTDLEVLDISDNNIETVDVSKNTKLEDLDCSENELKALDVSKNAALKNLDCSENELTSLKIPKNGGKLEKLDCSDNALDYATLPAGASKLGKDFITQPQAEYTKGIPDAKAAGKVLDISSQKAYEGSPTDIKWYDEDGSNITAGVKEDPKGSGKFIFDSSLKGETVYAKMTNPKAPGLTLITKSFLITDGGEWFINDEAKILKSVNSVVASADSSCKSGSDLIPISDLDKKDKKSDDTKLQFVTKAVTDTATTSKMLEQIRGKNKAFRESYKQHEFFDLSLMCADGKTAVKDFKGSITVTRKLPSSVAKNYDDYKFYVYHHNTTKGSEKIEAITPTVTADGITFTATSFSPYSLVWLTPRQINDADNVSSDPSSNPSSNPSSDSSSKPGSSAPGTGDKNSSANNAPKTGDDSAQASSAAWAILFISALVITALAVSGVYLYRKRKIIEESLNKDR